VRRRVLFLRASGLRLRPAISVTRHPAPLHVACDARNAREGQCSNEPEPIWCGGQSGSLDKSCGSRRLRVARAFLYDCGGWLRFSPDLHVLIRLENQARFVRFLHRFPRRPIPWRTSDKRFALRRSPDQNHPKHRPTFPADRQIVTNLKPLCHVQIFVDFQVLAPYPHRCHVSSIQHL
jgi:hypothetical protein